MRFFADFHIHSPYSRATSPLLNLRNIAIWSSKKGISVIGTGDFTHPKWLSEIEENLEEAEPGLYKLKEEISFPNQMEPRFIISGEISCIYKKNGRLRKIHNLILLPDIDSVKKLNKKLSKIGDLDADGRPILGLDSRDLLEIVLEANPDSFLIPAHIWTPWFSLFGSNSGFDDIEECFEDLKDHVYALETGLSSDPPMNRLLSCLDRYTLVSNSDAHSITKIGREANIFDTELNYYSIMSSMKIKEGFLGTIEFFPEEGKYHLDGHRRCNVCLDPKESIKLKNICPKCGNPITIGVLHRVYELADREEPVLDKPFYSLIPLPEILSEIMDCGVDTKKVKKEYERLISELGSEIDILMNLPLEEIGRVGGELLKEAIRRMREQRVIKKPGYDGEYGKIRLFEEGEKERLLGQGLLFQIPKKKEDKYERRFLRLEKKERAISEKEDMISDPILDGLDPEQKEAVLYNRGHLIIVAGPGSGKTLTLTHKIAYMIRSGIARPDQILAITFTNKAADEMRERINGLLSMLNLSAEGIWITTFHSFCLSILRQKGELIGIRNDFSVCPEWESEEIAKEVGGKRFLRLLPLIKKGKIDMDLEILDVYKAYEERLRSLNMLDIDDLEIKAYELLKKYPDIVDEISKKRTYIFVDEYQDTNQNQVGILKALSRNATICAIGDPDQAIYGFRGADRSLFLRFQEDFPNSYKVELTKNYRSCSEIIKAASSFIKRVIEPVINKRGKIFLNEYASDRQEAESVVENIEKIMGGISYFSLDSKRVESHEGDHISFGDIAILYRINEIGDKVEDALRRRGIPFVRSGEIPLREIYPVNAIYRLLLYLLSGKRYYLERYKRLISGRISEKEIDSLRKEDCISELINKILDLHDLDLKDEVSLKAIDKLKEMAERYGDLKRFVDELSLERGIDSIELRGDRVTLMSMHSSKGLEWKVIFIIGCEDGLIPCSIFGETDIEEEKRLFYVALTRAKEMLFLSYARKREIKGRILRSNPSYFLNKIPKDLFSIKEKKKKIKAKKQPIQLNLFN